MREWVVDAGTEDAIEPGLEMGLELASFLLSIIKDWSGFRIMEPAYRLSAAYWPSGCCFTSKGADSRIGAA